MPTERVDIVFNPKGSGRVVRSVEDIGRIAQRAETGVDGLRSSLDELSDVKSPLSQLRGTRSAVNSLSGSVGALRREFQNAFGEEFNRGASRVSSNLGQVTKAAQTTARQGDKIRQEFQDAFSAEFSKGAASAQQKLAAVEKEGKDVIAVGNRIKNSLRGVDSRGVTRARNELKGLASDGKRANDTLREIKRLLPAIGAAATITGVISLADAFTTTQNRLKTVVEGTAELEEVTRRLFDISNRTRSSYESTAELYSRLGLAAKDLGVSQLQLLEFTESLNQAVILSGASSQEADAGILQLSQGLASGALRGDELRSVLEQLPAVADVIAKRLKVTRGELRKLGTDGKITANIVLDAFKASREELNERFAKTVPTVAQSFTILKNRVIEYISAVDSGSGATAALSKGIVFVSENLDLFGKIASTVGITLTTVLVRRGIRSAIVGFRALTVAIATNPLGAILTLIVLATSALISFGDQIKLSSDGLATFSDFLVALLRQVVGFIKRVAQGFKELFQNFLGFLSSLFKDIDLSFKDFLIFLGFFGDAFIGLFRFQFNTVVAIFKNLPPVLAEIFTDALNFIIKAVERTVNSIRSSLATGLIDLIPGVSSIGRVSLDTVENPFRGSVESTANTITEEFNRLFEPGPIVRALENAFSDAESRAAERLRSKARKEVDLGRVSPAAPRPGDEKAIKKLREQLKRLENSLFPILAAQRELAEATRITDEAVKKLNLSEERATAIIEAKKKALEDQLDPLAATNRELDREIALLKLSSDERERVSRLQSVELKLRQQGIVLSEQETKDLRDKIALIQKLSERPPQIESPLKNLTKDILTTTQLLETAFVKVFGQVENAIVDLVRTGEFNFKKFVDNVLVDLTRLATRQALLQLVTAAGFGAAGGPAQLPGFQTGGSFIVGGSGPPDSRLVAFRASPGERVDVSTRKQQRQGGGSRAPMNITVNTTIQTPNPRAFNATEAQTTSRLALAIRASMRRNR